VEKTIKETRNRMATGDDVPGDVLKLLGEGGLTTLTKLMNTIYETGEWPKDFTEVTMIALKKNTKATKCSDHRTISLIAHTAKIIAKILKRKIGRKTEENRRIMKIKWTDKITNEELWRITEQKSVENQIKRRKRNWIGNTIHYAKKQEQ
jgi:hypothetical protein